MIIAACTCFIKNNTGVKLMIVKEIVSVKDIDETNICEVKINISKELLESQEIDYSFLLKLDREIEFSFECEGERNINYFVNYKVYSEGKLVKIGHYSIVLPQKIISLIVRGKDNPNLMIVDEYNKDTHVIRKPNLNWRKESVDVISIYEECGNVLFLKSLLAKYWILLNGNALKEIIESKKVNEVDLYKIINIFKKRNIIMLYEENYENE